MSIAKTLIQKEIAKYKRVIPDRESNIKRYKKLMKDPKNKIDFNGSIDHDNNDITLAKKYIKELEADLKKL